tara:strand:+ start:1417 stop:1623 length:207 start_codon:yes stop_codon:yes gene_type:complete
MIKNIYAAACVVACCMGNPALAQIPGCSLNGDSEAYNQCIRYTDVLRQQQWQIEEIQRQQQSDSYYSY